MFYKKTNQLQIPMINMCTLGEHSYVKNNPCAGLTTTRSSLKPNQNDACILHDTDIPSVQSCSNNLTVGKSIMLWPTLSEIPNMPNPTTVEEPLQCCEPYLSLYVNSTIPSCSEHHRMHGVSSGFRTKNGIIDKASPIQNIPLSVMDFNDNQFSSNNCSSPILLMQKQILSNSQESWSLVCDLFSDNTVNSQGYQLSNKSETLNSACHFSFTKSSITNSTVACSSSAKSTTIAKFDSVLKAGRTVLDLEKLSHPKRISRAFFGIENKANKCSCRDFHVVMKGLDNKEKNSITQSRIQSMFGHDYKSHGKTKKTVSSWFPGRTQAAEIQTVNADELQVNVLEVITDSKNIPSNPSSHPGVVINGSNSEDFETNTKDKANESESTGFSECKSWQAHDSDSTQVNRIDICDSEVLNEESKESGHEGERATGCKEAAESALTTTSCSVKNSPKATSKRTKRRKSRCVRRKKKRKSHAIQKLKQQEQSLALDTGSKQKETDIDFAAQLSSISAKKFNDTGESEVASSEADIDKLAKDITTLCNQSEEWVKEPLDKMDMLDLLDDVTAHVKN